MAKLFDTQPEWCRKPLPKKKIDWGERLNSKPEYIEKFERVLFFDPTEVYERIKEKINPYDRIQSISIAFLFPQEGDLCSCGCGRKARKRWATDVCSAFAWDVRNIICNTHQRPHFYINKYFGHDCVDCQKPNDSNLALDHIHPVKLGGGGCWLSNYEWRCHTHHVQKTNEDFGYKLKERTQYKLDL